MDLLSIDNANENSLLFNGSGDGLRIEFVPMQPHFADLFVTRSRDLGHPLCVGLDPHLNLIPEIFGGGDLDPAAPETSRVVTSFLLAILDRLPGRVAVVKPQIAFFERLGWRGLQALETLVGRARELELLVLLDAKRGDIGSTANAYAGAYLEPASPLPADALTLNPYLGLDSLEPFLRRADEHGKGLFVLAKTSNPGSGDFQDRTLDGGASLFATVASSLAERAEVLRGPETGWSNLGVVVGATYPGESESVRERLPSSLFLVPGYGAQGASAHDAVRGFVPGPGGSLEGGLVSSSRGILFPALDTANGGNAAARWESAVDSAIDRACDDLGQAIRR